ncbi:MAG: hypothetical protein HQL56_15080 [Magnetococcales bacterium]|nr:hypothetical protein [Magnetococcales bacterium]
MVLTITDKHDIHADRILNLLNKDDVYRLDLDTNSLKETSITYDGVNWIIETINEGRICSSSISSVYLRRPFVELTLQEQDNTDYNFKIWRGEWNKTLIGFYNYIRHVPWLNRLREAYRAENKYYQMEIAKQAGLHIPPILVSNNKAKLIEFVSRHTDVVLKLMNQEFYKHPDGAYKGIYVNKLSVSDFEDFGSTDENPIVLQPYVVKKFEVRYTVVGQDHFVCAIDSQKSKIANVDWRRYDIPNTPHFRIDPPQEIKKCVDNFMKLLELEFGALDFIVTHQDRWIFLEVNPMGQWLWLEDLTGLPISQAIANWLKQHSNIRRQ